MATNFKKQASQQRAAVPQVDPEGMKATIPTPPPGSSMGGSYDDPEQVTPAQTMQAVQQVESQLAPEKFRITIVNTSEAPVNRGFFMYPSRHRQVAKDLAYIEDRKPWQIIEDALEEYVASHYGKEYKRK